MTVYELIAKLSKLDPKTEVFLSDHGGNLDPMDSVEVGTRKNYWRNDGIDTDKPIVIFSI